MAFGIGQKSSTGVVCGVSHCDPNRRCIERFDPPDSPYDGHRGMDLLGQVVQQVRAALGGAVTYARMLAGRGVVVVDHGATRTTYEPVTASASMGAAVARGST